MTLIPDRAATRLAWTRRVLYDASLTLEPASADASFRSYWRTQHAGHSWIVMDSPPAQEDPAPWLEIGARLSTAGLHVPEVRAHDLEQGLLLIEDLGSQLYLPALNDDTVDTLYAAALDALLRMQRDVDTSGMQPYDHAFLQRELEIMPEWFLRRHLGCTPECEEWDVLESAFTALLKSALEQPRCFVHRDYHSRNLLITAHNSPGIIDFQGALHGPVTYDLASLLRDCYIVWDRSRVEAWVETHRLRLLDAGMIAPAVSRERFLRWFDLIGLQRHIKVLGIFCRLYYQDGKSGYLDDLPRVYDYVISVAARHPELADFVAFMQRQASERDLRQVSVA
jgi:aminoglycoside/choline kinase family phosphotransferase